MFRGALTAFCHSPSKGGSDVSSDRKTIIAGNWKMHKTHEEAAELASAVVKGVEGKSDLPEVVLCPPFTALAAVVDATRGSNVKVGAQNMDYRNEGAFTGEISPIMLSKMGVTHVILGHSERRQFFGETNSTVNLKLKAALEHGLVPIVCVGESLDERESGLTDSVVRRQVAAALEGLTEADIDTLVIAYEPVWAIGTGKTCEATEANRVAESIRSTVNDFFATEAGSKSKIGETIPILYGGSVKASNVDEQLELPHIDGSLVGGASLSAPDFLPIIEGGSRRVKLTPSAS